MTMKKQTKQRHLWVRTGDACEYESVGSDLDAVALHLAEAGCRTPFSWNETGFQCAGFEADNHVSCFWGDSDAGFEKPLTKAEREAVEQEVNQWDRRTRP